MGRQFEEARDNWTIAWSHTPANDRPPVLPRADYLESVRTFLNPKSTPGENGGIRSKIEGVTADLSPDDHLDFNTVEGHEALLFANKRYKENQQIPEVNSCAYFHVQITISKDVPGAQGGAPTIKTETVSATIFIAGALRYDSEDEGPLGIVADSFMSAAIGADLPIRDKLVYVEPRPQTFNKSVVLVPCAGGTYLGIHQLIVVACSKQLFGPGGSTSKWLRRPFR